ncbi:hypothetical protein MAR_033279, partial [Mya arenaria]
TAGKLLVLAGSSAVDAAIRRRAEVSCRQAGTQAEARCEPGKRPPGLGDDAVVLGRQARRQRPGVRTGRYLGRAEASRARGRRDSTRQAGRLVESPASAQKCRKKVKVDVTDPHSGGTFAWPEPQTICHSYVCERVWEASQAGGEHADVERSPVVRLFGNCFSTSEARRYKAPRSWHPLREGSSKNAEKKI